MKVCSVCQRCFEDEFEICDAVGHGPLTARPEIGRDAVEGYLFERLLEKRPDLEIYRAAHRQTEKPVTIAILQIESDAEADKLERERRASAGVDQLNLARFYESGRIDDKRFYLVDEVCAGAPLEEYLKSRGRLSEREAILVARQTAEALEALHGAGVTHGAINSNSIVVADDGGELFVKLRNIDFGGVRARSAVASVNRIDEQTDALAYLAPEQIEGAPADRSSDIYSLGVVLYEMLIGALPYERLSAPAILDFVFTDKPFEKLRFDVRALLAHLLRESLQKRSHLRPPSAGNLARQLRHVEKLVAPAPIAFRDFSAPKTARAAAVPTPPAAPPTLAEEILAAPPAEADFPATAEIEESQSIDAPVNAAFVAPPPEAEITERKTKEGSAAQDLVLPLLSLQTFAPEDIGETEEERLIVLDEPARAASTDQESAPVDFPPAVEAIAADVQPPPEIEEPAAAKAAPEQIQTDQTPLEIASAPAEESAPVTRKLVPIPALAEMAEEFERNVAAKTAPSGRESKENAVAQCAPQKTIEPAADDALPRAFIHLKESYTSLKIRRDAPAEPVAADDEYEMIDDEAIEYETIDEAPEAEVEKSAWKEPAGSANNFDGFGAYAGGDRSFVGGRGVYLGAAVFGALILLGLFSWNFAGRRQQASTLPENRTAPVPAQPAAAAPVQPDAALRGNQSTAEKRATAATETGVADDENTTVARQNARATAPPAKTEKPAAAEKNAKKTTAGKSEPNTAKTPAKTAPAPKPTEKPKIVAVRPSVDKPKPSAARGDGLTRPRVVAGGN